MLSGGSSAEAAVIASVNLDGTIEVQQAAIAGVLRHLIQFGTSSIFGCKNMGVAALDGAEAAILDNFGGITN
jgi:nucleoside-diphosphate-sugar epimerase